MSDRIVVPTVTAARFPSEYGQSADSMAETLPWDDVAARIAAAKNYWLAASDDAGRPYQRPIDGTFVDGALCFGGSPQTRWVRYLQQRPAVSLSLPDDDHAVILEGDAALMEDEHDPLSVALAPANRAKYPQYFSDESPSPFLAFWYLRPARVFAWSLTGFPAKATRFDFT